VPSLKPVTVDTVIQVMEFTDRLINCISILHKADAKKCATFEETHTEQVNHFQYLGSIVNNSNSTEEEIKER
jgi:ribosome-interacting GTPase 1